MTQLRLGLLGPPLVELAGEKVTFATAKARALLVYLALESDRPHPRESLMTLFWDQSDDSSARTSLRQALAVLRDALGDAERAEPFLLVTRDAVQLNPAADVAVDVQAFRRHILNSTKPTGRPGVRVPAVAAAREQALALYRGEFLAGAVPADSLAFAEWAVIWRERLHQQALEAAVGLAQHRELCGDGPGAVRMWRRALALEPWREDAHAAVMRLLAASGDRAAALAQYATAQKVLSEELAAEPGQALRALRQAVEREDASLLTPPTRPHAPIVGGDLVGRDAELDQLAEWLVDPTRRVITVHGPGGVGKTRLALDAAARNAVLFPDGAVVVSLSAILAPTLVPDAILRALEVEVGGETPLDDQVRAALQTRTTLLVLDNADHLLPELAEPIAGWLAAAPGLTLLVTSRTRLGLQAEWVLPLRGLSYAATGPSRADDAAAALFALRVRRHRPDYVVAGDADALGRLCRAVEGLPLALELAASLNPDRSVAEIAAALETEEPVLAASWPDAPERHRSVAALFEYSWRALEDPARYALACAATFRGGFDDCAAAAIMDLPAEAAGRRLAVLVDRALVREDAGRFSLHELVRAFAAHKLAALPDGLAPRRRHRDYFARVTRQAAEDANSVAPVRLRTDLDNIRAALAFALDVPEPLAAAELAMGFSTVFWRAGLTLEAQAWLERAIAALEAQPELPGRDSILARALNEIGINASILVRSQEAEAYLERALAYARRDDDPIFLARVLGHLARNCADLGAFERAETLMREGLAVYEAARSELGVTRAHMTLGEIALLAQDQAKAVGYFEAALERLRRLDSKADLVIVLGNLGMARGELGHSAEGQRLLEECITLAREIGHDYVIAAVQAPLASLHVQEARTSTDDAARQAHLTRARELTGNAIRDTHAQGLGLFRASGILQMADVEAAAGQAETAARLLGAAEMAQGLAGVEWEATHRTLRDRLVETLPATLGATGFAAARAYGAALSLDEALTLALGAPL